MPDKSATAAALSSIDMTRVGKAIRRLHDQVCGSRRRVEITRAGCEDVCVMISKRELEAIEHALTVLAASADFNGLCHKLSDLLKEAGVVYHPRSYQGEPPCTTFSDELAGRV